jgi:hypothetical protein
MNAGAKPPQVVVQASPHHGETHRRLEVHETGGLGETLWGTRLVPALRRRLQGPNLGWHGLEK